MLILRFFMSNRIKIVHIQLLPLMSGVQKVSLDELMHLDRLRYEPIVICKKEGEFTENLKKIGVRVHLIPELEREISPIRDIKALLALRNFLVKERPDIVHSHSSKTGILGRVAAYISGVPLIVHTVHGFSFPGESRMLIRVIFKFLERMVGKITDQLIVLNKEDATIARDALKVPLDRLVLLPNGVDIATYAPVNQSERNALRLGMFGVNGAEHVLIGMVGRLWYQKNPHCFVRAAVQVLNRTKNASFFLIGDGEFRDDLEKIITESGHGGMIRILGWRSDISEILKAIDIVVLPSRWEGMPLAILEAMSTAVPVVASDIPGNNHLISDGVDGLLFPSNDSDALATAMLELIDNVDKRSCFSVQARQKILHGFTLEERIKKLTLIYESSRYYLRKAAPTVT